MAQLGQLADNANPMKGELRELTEIVAKNDDGTYRLMYTVKLGDRIHVLHAFQEKSTRGIAAPKRETDLIKQRLQIARVKRPQSPQPKHHARESRNDKR